MIYLMHKFIKINVHVLLDLFVLEPSADQSLRGVERVGGIGDGLSFGGHASQTLSL